MTLIQIILIGLLYYCGSSFWLDGWLTVNHPFIGAFLTGCILNNPMLGAYYGAYLQMMFMGWMRMGGNDNIDSCFGGIISTALAISLKLDIGSTLIFAYIFSLLTKNVWNKRNIYNETLMKEADEAINEGNINKLYFINLWKPQLKLLYLTFIPTIIVLIITEPLISYLYNLLNDDVIKYLNCIGGLLPIIGICSTFKLTYKNKYLPFIFIALILNLLFINKPHIVLLIALISGFIFLLIILKDKKIKLEKRNNIYKKISILDLIICDIRMYLYQYQSVNYERYQALGFVHSIGRVLKKLYKKDEIVEPLNRYGHESYNIEPYFGTVLLGNIIAMEEDKYLNDINTKEISDYKNFMVSPISAIGDQMNQLLLNTIILTLGFSISLSTSINGGYISLFLMIFVLFFESLYFVFKGYVYGKEYLLELLRSEKLNIVIEVETIIVLIILTTLQFNFINTTMLINNFYLSKVLNILFCVGCYYLYGKSIRPVFIICIILIIGLACFI